MRAAANAARDFNNVTAGNLAAGLDRVFADYRNALVVQRNDNTHASRLGSYERHQSACQVVEL
jgi:hypothetical protein